MSIQVRPLSRGVAWDKVTRGGVVYALKFSDGMVKIGKTSHLRQRLTNMLNVQRKAFGVSLANCYFTGVHDSYSATEDFAIWAAESLLPPDCGPREREWFFGIDFEALEGLLSELDPTSYYNAPMGRVLI